MNALTVISIIVKVTPLIVPLIQAIEQLIPQPGEGTRKLSIFRVILEMLEPAAKDIWPHIEKIVGIFVKEANESGVFETTKGP